MPRNANNIARVEQDSASKAPILLAGDITPVVMREFEEGCVGYFETKEVEEEKMVWKILPGLKDSRIRDWIATDCDRLRTLSFEEFMIEFRAAYLDEDWEENTHRELGGMVQGEATFWDYAIEVQSKNSLLTTTASHLDNEKLRHRIKASMNKLLARHCINAKVNKEGDFKKWLAEVKCIDDTLHAERREFERISEMNRKTARKS
jgi:hypothetical protein